MKKPRRQLRWTALYGTALLLFTTYVLLDTFVIPRSYAAVQSSDAAAQETVEQSSDSSVSESRPSHHHGKDSFSGADDTDSADSQTGAYSSGSVSTDSQGAVTGDSYESDGVSITVTTTRYCDTTVYVADVSLDDPTGLLTALAANTYGKNITEATSSIAAAHNAVLAINGDYYGSQNTGYVIRNGTLYRSASSGDRQEDLVIRRDGTFEIIEEGDITAQELVDSGAWQVLSFGPGLVENGALSVDPDQEVDQAKTSNPRTAIGQIGTGHYVLVVADGRTSQSAGLSLYQLAELLENLDCTTAYNLDGGGSSTMYFNGTVINQPTTNGSNIRERNVSDIVYIGL